MTPATRPPSPRARLACAVAGVLLAAWGLAHQERGALPLPLVLGYFGPETVMPLASVLTVVVGVILACWKWLVRLVKRLLPRKPE